MKNNILNPIDYKEELVNIAESRNFSQDAENLLLSMLYKIEDSFNNYKTVKREVPDREEFIESIIFNVKNNCAQILIATPKSKLERELKAKKCKILNENESRIYAKRVISYPNEKTLLYGITKSGINPLNTNLPTEEKAILTAFNIGRCISTSEVIRDFNGWSWSILENEIESTECNLVYIFISYLLGYKFAEGVTVEKIKNNVSKEFFTELTKVAIQFYMSYDKSQNEQILKKLAENKKKLANMKNQASYIMQIADMKKDKIDQVNRLDSLLNDPKRLREEYLKYNSKLPDEQKIFSVSYFADKLEQDKKDLMNQIGEYNKMQNPMEFVKIKDRLEYEIKLYEEKTDISGLEKAFLKMFDHKLNNLSDKKEILDYIYKVRYLNNLPNCSMKLNKIKEKIIPIAINGNVIAPVSNNDDIDSRILKGIFDSKTVNMENLYIKLSSTDNMLHVELYDNDILEKKYDVILPEGSQIEIRKTRRTKIFEK